MLLKRKAIIYGQKNFNTHYFVKNRQKKSKIGKNFSLIQLKTKFAKFLKLSRHITCSPGFVSRSSNFGYTVSVMIRNKDSM